jgi:hypothetical protein
LEIADWLRGLSLEHPWRCWIDTALDSPNDILQRETAESVAGNPLSELEIIKAALAESRGRVSGPSGAAVKLGIPSSTLEYRIKALKIRKSQFKFR